MRAALHEWRNAVGNCHARGTVRVATHWELFPPDLQTHDLNTITRKSIFFGKVDVMA